MLSGIKTGKKKKKRKTVEGSTDDAPKRDSRSRDDGNTTAGAKKHRHNSNNNLSAAQLLKQQLAAGITPTSSRQDNNGLDARLSRATKASSSHEDDKNVVVLTGAAAATLSDRPDYRPEDFRHGSRKGKLKRPQAVDVAGTSQQEASQTIQEMIQEEHIQTRSMDEVYARNVARIGSRYKGKDFSSRNSKTGADEDDVQVDMNMFQSSQSNLTTLAAQQKERSRQLAQHDKEASLTKRFWWWLESPSFEKHTLLALGNHVSMVMVPSHLSLIPGTQVYLVPIKHSDSLVNCEDDVWNELAQFQQSLRNMYAKENKDVVFMETVLPSKGLWQTRLQAIPIPKRQNDAPLYFKNALTEQAQEWGTHTKLLSTRNKGLRRTIPKKFPYFYVEWNDNDGYAQIIETTSFPQDFGVDTVAGMMQMDPLKFRARKKTSPETERQLILDFVAKWKPFDWTLELD